MLPPSLHEFVPPGHMAHFVRDTVREALDLSAILDVYKEERGYPPYHPGMMVALLLYGYSRGLYSSRQLARACEERVDVMAVDGTKLKANASRNKAMSYGRMKTVERALAAEVDVWLEHAYEADAAEDVAHGPDRPGDETPDWMADKQRRRETIRAAKAALETEAVDPPAPEDESGPGASSGMRWQGRPLRGEDGGPSDRAQRNFTDPDSRILPTRDGFVQGYNGQIAVDAAHQVIVAHRLVTNSADSRALVPLVDNARAHLGRKPREVSGDAGFANEGNLDALKQRRITAYLAPGRARHGQPDATGRRKLTKTPLMRAMATRLKRAGRRSRYRLRKQVVERVFGQIKQARGFRQFLLRGLDQVRGEWAMICTAHNLLKFAKARR